MNSTLELKNLNFFHSGKTPKTQFLSCKHGLEIAYFLNFEIFMNFQDLQWYRRFFSFSICNSVTICFFTLCKVFFPRWCKEKTLPSIKAYSNTNFRIKKFWKIVKTFHFLFEPLKSLKSTCQNEQNAPFTWSRMCLDPDFSPDEQEEKARLISQVNSI